MQYVPLLSGNKPQVAVMCNVPVSRSDASKSVKEGRTSRQASNHYTCPMCSGSTGRQVRRPIVSLGPNDMTGCFVTVQPGQQAQDFNSLFFFRQLNVSMAISTLSVF